MFLLFRTYEVYRLGIVFTKIIPLRDLNQKSYFRLVITLKLKRDKLYLLSLVYSLSTKIVDLKNFLTNPMIKKVKVGYRNRV